MDVLKVPHESLQEGHIVFKNLVTSNFMMREGAGKKKRKAKADSDEDEQESEHDVEPEAPPVARASPFRKSSNINFFVSDAMLEAR